MLDFYSMTRRSLERRCEDLGVSAMHARDLFRSAYKRLGLEPWSGNGFPVRLKSSLAEQLTTEGMEIASSHESGYDQSVKFIVRLSDGARVEAVLMPEKKRLTLCLSSQVGCAQACVFCHTGRMGLTRNLSTGEIVGQVVLAERWLERNAEWRTRANVALRARVGNIVFMGMGEPLDNADAVADALQILVDPYGLALGLSRISVSTAGHLEGIERLAARIPRVRLALSVHSTDDQKRSKIMPINRRWPLHVVMARLRELFGERGEPVMLQFTMIRGVNDSPEEAHRLADMTKGLHAKVNLIPLNPVTPSRLSAPDPEAIQAFRDVLHERGIRVMVRYSKGQDIAAACGQLIVQ